MTKLLNQLTITEKPAKNKLSTIEKRQQKLISKLDEQQEMAKCLLEGVEFTAYKFKSITDPETGAKSKVKVPKRIRPWFYECKGSYFLEIKYGSKSLELAKGKTAITVGEKEKIPTILAIVSESVLAGELDSQLNAIQAPARKVK
ncbi:MAG: DUF6641 family protein [Psychromonas sp.]